MKKLIETPEAESYTLEVRDKVVSLVGAQLLFEWRFCVTLIGFIIVGSLVFRFVERIDTFWVQLLIGCMVIIPGALLWSYVSWRLQRWTLSNRRDALLHAVQSPELEVLPDTKKMPAEQAVSGNRRYRL
jgi:hypothetical protein